MERAPKSTERSKDEQKAKKLDLLLSPEVTGGVSSTRFFWEIVPATMCNFKCLGCYAANNARPILTLVFRKHLFIYLRCPGINGVVERYQRSLPEKTCKICAVLQPRKNPPAPKLYDTHRLPYLGRRNVEYVSILYTALTFSPK